MPFSSPSLSIASRTSADTEKSVGFVPFGYRIVMSTPEDPIRRPLGFVAGFAAAASFFTRLPLDPGISGAWQLADSSWAFPLVGAGIGAVAALVFVLAELIGLGAWPAALLAVLAAIALTGGLHEDGLADTVDGFAGGPDRETKLAIMRDSRQGSFGVLAVVLSVMLRSASLATIGDVLHAPLALIAAHAISRAALPLVMLGLTPARADGLGATAGTPRQAGVITAMLLGAFVAMAALGPLRGLVALSLTGLAICAAAWTARRQIGGYTGDVLGAIQQVGEIVMLLAASAR
jgi:adenosylcobinamide-GDP ribazoletransferase